MRIIIETIPHGQQRYNTCGDWLVDGDNLTIRVSQLKDWRASMLIGVHELVEALLCKARNIDPGEVDAFDCAFGAPVDSEPGDDPAAPYHREHCTATGIERIMAAELKVAWQPYEAELDQLTREYPNHGQ